MKKFFAIGFIFPFLFLALTSICSADVTVKLGLLNIASSKNFQRLSVPLLFNHTILFFGNTNTGKSLYAARSNKIFPVISQGRYPVSDSQFNFYRFINNEMLPNLSTPSFGNNCLAFYGENRTKNKGIYVACDNSFHKVVDTQTAISDSTDSTFMNVYKPWIIDQNNIAFIGETKQTSGLYIGTINNAIKPLIKTQFSKITDLAFSSNNPSANDFIFIGLNFKNEPTLYHYHNNKLETIADVKTQIPKGIGYFTNFYSIGYDENSGSIAFIGKGILQQKGVYLFDGKKLIKLVDQKTMTPNSFNQFTDFSSLSISNHSIVFEGSYNENKSGLFFITQDELIKLISTDDPIDNQYFSKIEFGNPAFNGNELTFLVTTKDGSQIIYKGVIQE